MRCWTVAKSSCRWPRHSIPRDLACSPTGSVSCGWCSPSRNRNERQHYKHGCPPVCGFSREFDAPREKLWAAWTERERLMQWFGPKGCTMPSSTISISPRRNLLLHAIYERPAASGEWVFHEIQKTQPPRIRSFLLGQIGGRDTASDGFHLATGNAFDGHFR